MMTSSLSNLVIHWKEVIYYILSHDGTAEPLRVSPPEAVDYVFNLMIAYCLGSKALFLKLNYTSFVPVYRAG